MALKISRKGDYGLLLMKALAQEVGEGRFVSLKEVAKEKKLPYKFVGQIVARLLSAGLVESKEGVRGGYRLTRDAKQISVGEILGAVEGQVMEVGCSRDDCGCGGACVHEEVSEKMAEAVDRTLAGYTLADLV